MQLNSQITDLKRRSWNIAIIDPSCWTNWGATSQNWRDINVDQYAGVQVYQGILRIVAPIAFNINSDSLWKYSHLNFLHKIVNAVVIIITKCRLFYLFKDRLLYLASHWVVRSHFWLHVSCYGFMFAYLVGRNLFIVVSLLNFAGSFVQLNLIWDQLGQVKWNIF